MRRLGVALALVATACSTAVESPMATPTTSAAASGVDVSGQPATPVTRPSLPPAATPATPATTYLTLPPTRPPDYSPSPPPAPEYAIGEPVPLWFADTVLPTGTVTVLAVDPDAPNRFGGASPASRNVTAHVRYDAAGEMSYGLFDWHAHDEKGNHFQIVPVTDAQRQLRYGLMKAGDRAEGWVTFDVPRSSEHLWMDYGPTAYDTIFSVRLF